MARSPTFIIARYQRIQRIRNAILLAYKANSLGLMNVAKSQANDAIFIANNTRDKKLINFVTKKVRPIMVS